MRDSQCRGSTQPYAAPGLACGSAHGVPKGCHPRDVEHSSQGPLPQHCPATAASAAATRAYCPASTLASAASAPEAWAPGSRRLPPRQHGRWRPRTQLCAALVAQSGYTKEAAPKGRQGYPGGPAPGLALPPYYATGPATGGGPEVVHASPRGSHFRWATARAGAGAGGAAQRGIPAADCRAPRPPRAPGPAPADRPSGPSHPPPSRRGGPDGPPARRGARKARRGGAAPGGPWQGTVTLYDAGWRPTLDFTCDEDLAAAPALALHCRVNVAGPRQRGRTEAILDLGHCRRLCVALPGRAEPVWGTVSVAGVMYEDRVRHSCNPPDAAAGAVSVARTTHEDPARNSGSPAPGAVPGADEYHVVSEVQYAVDNTADTRRLRIVQTPWPLDEFWKRPAVAWPVRVEFLAPRAAATGWLSLCLPPYEPGRRLLVVHQDALVEVAVVDVRSGNRYRLQQPDGALLDFDLNIHNHCLLRLASLQRYRVAVREYFDLLQRGHRTLAGFVTGVPVRVRDEAVRIRFASGAHAFGGGHREGWSDADDARALARLYLTPPSQSRSQGAHATQPVVLVGGPGAGKTTGCHQLVHELIAGQAMEGPSGMPLVPVLIRAEHVMGLAPGQGDLGLQHLVQYVKDYVAAGHEDRLLMLLQAMQLRAVVFVIDGLDEAGDALDRIGRLVRTVLVPMGWHVVVTCRPGGDWLKECREGFAVLRLLPLTTEQQRQAVMQQLQGRPAGREFAEHLIGLASIRAMHDDIWRGLSEAARAALEAVPSDEECGDAEPRQKCEDGTRAVRRRDGGIRSAFANGLSGRLRPLLGALEQRLGAVVGAETEEEVVCAVNDAFGRDAAAEVGLAVRLCLFFKKQQTSANPVLDLASLTAFWEDIVGRTDEIYEVAEALKPKAEAAVQELLKGALRALGEVTLQRTDAGDGFALSLDGTAVCRLVFGPLQDPVGVCERALCEHADRVEGGELPEACVADVIRMTVACADAGVMRAILERLSRADAATVDLPSDSEGAPTATGGPVHVKKVRTQNMCAAPGPARVRKVRMTLALWSGPLSAFVDVQVVPQQVFDYHQQSPAHDHLAFFRRKSSDGCGERPDERIEQMMHCFEEIQGVPLLLSLLALLLGQGVTVDMFPASLYELYERSLARTSPEERGPVLQKVAVANHLSRRTTFRPIDVEEALDEAERTHWNGGDLSLLQKSRLQGGDAGAVQLRFRHHSFQEGLFACALIEHQVDEFWDNGVLDRLRDGWYEHSFRIGGRELGRQLKRFFISEVSLAPDRQAWKVLTTCLSLESVFQGVDWIQHVDLGQCECSYEDMVLLGELLTGSTLNAALQLYRSLSQPGPMPSGIHRVLADAALVTQRPLLRNFADLCLGPSTSPDKQRRELEVMRARLLEDVLASKDAGAVTCASSSVTLLNAARVSFAGMDLRGICIPNAVLHQAELTGANLQAADLAGADLRGAVLEGADLTGANLKDVSWS